MITGRCRTHAWLAAIAFAVFACTEAPMAVVSPTATPTFSVEPFSTALLTPQWQERARGLVRTYGLNPIAAGRIYAALSVAQYRAVLAADEDGSAAGAESARGFGPGGRALYETHRGAVSGASAVVLGFLFPADAAAFERQVDADANAGPGNVHPEFVRGLAAGRTAGNAMVEHLKNDGSTLPWGGTIPVGPGYWVPNGPPAGANLGGVTPYLINSTSQFRSPPPPAFGSPAFLADLDEVLTIALNRTSQQIAIAQSWAAAGAGSTPLGYWNETAATYIQAANLSERAATHVFALMHAAQFDAQLTCFESKYHYFVLRPNQAEPMISLVIGQPNYPAYPSGHACISSSSANVLAYFFPGRAAELADLVDEAGLSRILGGIHYRFDITAAWDLGRAVADWAISRQQDLN